MNFDEYMDKFQKISKLLEKANCAEDILNSQELNISEDFQYICLNSSANYDLVIEIISRLAQNGNIEIIQKNIKSISMSMWKDLFNKNDYTKQLFINNFNTIYQNTNIMTCREIEQFMLDKDTSLLIYENLNKIIKKLSTYDRASLIALLKDAPEGTTIIKQNLLNFLQKGDFDISTAYSKVLIRLSEVTNLDKLDILKACSGNLSEMLSRETAIDNETNELLNWLYDTFEETKMTNYERSEIKKNIDKAILENFNQILDKTNYDKNTIKILKQFDCTRYEFETNKNLFIEKANAAELEKYEFNTNNQDYSVETSNNIQKNDDNSNYGKEPRHFDVNLKDENNNEVQNGYKNVIHYNFNSNKYVTAEDLINSYINQVNEKNENKKIQSEADLDSKLKNLIVSNVEETNKIIDRVLNKNNNQSEYKDDKLNNVGDNNPSASNYNYNAGNENQNASNDEQTAITISHQELEELFYEKDNIFKRIWKKIKSLFGFKSRVNRIDE